MNWMCQVMYFHWQSRSCLLKSSRNYFAVFLTIFNRMGKLNRKLEMLMHSDEPAIAGPRTDLSRGRGRCHPLVRGHHQCSYSGLAGQALHCRTTGVPRRCRSCPSAPAVDDKEDAVCLSGVDLGGFLDINFRTYLQSWLTCWRGILRPWKSRKAPKLELDTCI